MSTDNSNNNNSSFSHAFLPGLILGIIVGAVAATFLPVLTGPKIPASNPSEATVGDSTPHDRVDDSMSDEELQKLIDEAEEQLEDAAEAGEDAINDAAEEIEGNIPGTPPRDG